MRKNMIKNKINIMPIACAYINLFDVFSLVNNVMMLCGEFIYLYLKK